MHGKETSAADDRCPGQARGGPVERCSPLSGRIRVDPHGLSCLFYKVCSLEAVSTHVHQTAQQLTALPIVNRTQSSKLFTQVTV